MGTCKKIDVEEIFEYIKFDFDSLKEELYNFVGDAWSSQNTVKCGYSLINPNLPDILENRDSYIEFLIGDILLLKGDYMLKNKKGELIGIRSDMFNSEYIDVKIK